MLSVFCVTGRIHPLDAALQHQVSRLWYSAFWAVSWQQTLFFQSPKVQFYTAFQKPAPLTFCKLPFVLALLAFGYTILNSSGTGYLQKFCWTGCLSISYVEKKSFGLDPGPAELKCERENLWSTGTRRHFHCAPAVLPTSAITVIALTKQETNGKSSGISNFS